MKDYVRFWMEQETHKMKHTLNKNYLLQLFGTPLLNLSQLQRALNYRSVAAIKQRETMPVRLFELPNRRGKFALAKNAASF